MKTKLLEMPVADIEERIVQILKSRGLRNVSSEWCREGIIEAKHSVAAFVNNIEGWRKWVRKQFGISGDVSLVELLAQYASNWIVETWNELQRARAEKAAERRHELFVQWCTPSNN